MPTAEEYRQTLLLAITLAEASAKIRTGGPNDPEEADAPIWAGVLPLSMQPGVAEPAHDLPPGIDLPLYVSEYRRPTPA